MTSDFCEVCELPELPIDPLTIWEHIPCPLEEFKEDLFSNDLLTKLGPEKGMSIILNIAKRCDIKVPKLFPTSGHVSGAWIFDTCGQDCISTTVGICLSVLLVMVVITLAGFARRECGWFQLSRDKYVIEHISTIISEDGNGSEYKFTTKSQDDELSSIYVARWFKIFVADNCSDNEHSIHKHSSDSRCICKRLAEHIYEDIDSCKGENENTGILSKSYRKYCNTDEDLVLMKQEGNECDSTAEICSNNISNFPSNDYETLKKPRNNKDANGVDNNNPVCFNESPNELYLRQIDENECIVLLSNDTYNINSFERLNSNISAHSGTPLLRNDSSESDSMNAVT
ncbi:uncharacterized protein LOC127732634 isoform X1 [Mytilus californianus]|uniref:uncharacterized protein LOC127732634 isoform X1 n=1 Tax=Mytilus californianus TaxID=6549 RepID=UPI00224662D5|nr:uncharacterized protein LOC127732634 isoform X1 [Mytilus californianus]XP_052097672.1 uncharacterized protein LOC127732634 isoform X1 [Mytilus californianus]XP_052097673.1 uncharacterized protein LOC127732634 isoform X1 [Mytilus californianus]XP_052097674.1 uncharacterized protein LOC127732634 isoform X1 [Mytilus californianus]XP_052097676.1 uncharacterized protein LOC127732634 isoform X1 [Mytilus californianus]XP_052097677.1 uncharacterized protein LOC127732634 isoform X1 [Mytilus californ